MWGCFGVGDLAGVEDSWRRLVGSMLVLSHDGDKTKLGRFTVRRLAGILGISGLSLNFLRVLPLGGLTPKVGRVVIFSRFGWV